MVGSGQRVLLRHYLEQKLTKSAIARQVGVNRSTVHRWIETGHLNPDLDDEAFSYGPRVSSPSKLDLYEGIVKARLTSHPKLKAMRLFRDVQAAGRASPRSSACRSGSPTTTTRSSPSSARSRAIGCRAVIPIPTRRLRSASLNPMDVANPHTRVPPTGGVGGGRPQHRATPALHSFSTSHHAGRSLTVRQSEKGHFRLSRNFLLFAARDVSLGNPIRTSGTLRRGCPPTLQSTLWFAKSF